MIRIEVKDENDFHKVDAEIKLVGYDKAVEQLSSVFTTLYKNIPERILVEALYSSKWGKHIVQNGGKHISELAED